MEKHDHPTASQRLGDSEAGSGAAATLTARRRGRDPQDRRRAVCFRRHPQERACGGRIEAVVHPNAWRRCFAAADSPGLDVLTWPFFQQARTRERGTGDRARLGGQRAAFWDRESRREERDDMETAVRSRGRRRQRELAGDGDARRRPIRRGLRPFTTIQRLLNLSKLNDISLTTASSGEVSRVSRRNHRRAAHAS